MKNADLTVEGSDQRTYYNAAQLSLSLTTDIVLPADDPVCSFLDAVKGVNFSKYVRPIRSNNTHSHDRGRLLRVLLFAFQNRMFSLDDIVQACRTDIRFIFLSCNERPSKMAFSRLISQMTEPIDDLFRDLNLELIDKTGTDINTQFVDGTKIEANAYKNSFVYKKRILNARDKLYLDISKAISSLNFSYGYNYPISANYNSLEVWYIVQYLMEVMVHEKIEIVYGKGHHRSDIQKRYDTLLSYAMRLSSYEYWLWVIGDRHSCSKSDHDATFMATKWDYYNQSGVTRPCYNCQIAVSNGMIINADVYQNPGDTVTWERFMNRHHTLYGIYPAYPTADAGYGSYDNYLFDLSHGINLVQKFPMYGKEHDPKFRKRQFFQLNWETNKDGFKVCPNNRVFCVREKDRVTHTKGGYLSVSQIYTEPKHCADCPLKSECLSSFNKCGYRKISKNPIAEELQNEARKQLDSERGIQLKINRAIQAEGAFGVIKQDMGFTRFHRKGLKNVKMEFLFVCMGYNLRKYHCWRLRQMASVPNMKLN